MARLPQRVFLANLLAGNDNLTRQLKYRIHMALINNNTDKDILVTFYNIIWPGNGTGLFLQPQNPRGPRSVSTCLRCRWILLQHFTLLDSFPFSALTPLVG